MSDVGGFFLTCSSCGEPSPSVADEVDVVDAATDAEWQVEGVNDFDRDLCPSCVVSP